MGMLKLLRKSIIFSTRSRRRFFTFVIVFALLSGATILLLSYFDNFSREGLLEHRGVVIKASSLGSVDYQTALADIGTNIPDAEAVIYYRYVDFSGLRICSINTRYKWAFTEIKPNDLVDGSFPASKREALVSNQLLLLLSGDRPPVSIYTEPVVNTKFQLNISNNIGFELRISGIFDKPKPPSYIATDSTHEWIFIPEGSFAELIGLLNINNDQIDVHSISIIASGDIFFGESYSNVNNIATRLDTLGSAYESPDFTAKADKDDQRNMMVLSLVFGMFGTFMVSTLYSYLITRFRRREVAVLKAMGYSSWNVRIVVLSEILVVAITGYVIGLLAIQGYLYLVSQGSYVFLIIFSSTAIFSFFAVVIFCIPGFFLITFRILAVRPIEIFRQK